MELCKKKLLPLQRPKTRRSPLVLPLHVFTEGFSSCFKKEIESGSLHELKITRNALGISHILFVEDTSFSTRPRIIRPLL
jgi:hypothetical protein